MTPCLAVAQDSLSMQILNTIPSKDNLCLSLKKEEDNRKFGTIIIASGVMFTAMDYFIWSKEVRFDGKKYDNGARYLGLGLISFGTAIQIRSLHRISKRKS